MKLSKILLFISTTISMFFVSACGEHVQKYQPIYNDNGDIMMQFSEDAFKDKEYKDILEDMKDMGFKNFKINFNGSLLLGIINHENEIYQAYVNDKLKFIENSYVPKESIVYLEVFSKEKKMQYITSAVDEKVPAMFGSTEFSGKSRTDTINEMRSAGITNYELIPIYDCSSTSSYSYDCVEKIEINSSSNYSWYTFVDQGAKYSIFYHDLQANQGSSEGGGEINPNEDESDAWYNKNYSMMSATGREGTIVITVQSFTFSKNNIALCCSVTQSEIDSLHVSFHDTTAKLYYVSTNNKSNNTNIPVTKPENFDVPRAGTIYFSVVMNPNGLDIGEISEINYYFTISGVVDGVYRSEDAELYPQFVAE